MTRPLFFSEVDDQFAPFVNRTKFRTDLACRILLEPQLVMSDIFFIISDKIEEDVARGTESSWILNALSQGIIVPAFRSSSFDFVDVLLASRRKKTIGIHDKARQTAELLNRALRESSETPIEWPPSLGVKFRENAERVLLTDASLSDQDREVWARAGRYREEYLTRALSKASPEDGLTRSTYLREVAADWNFGGNPANWKRMLRRVPDEERAFVSAAIRWMNEVYNYTHAIEFSTRPSFPITEGIGSQVVARKVFNSTTTMGDSTECEDERSYFFKVTWPSGSALRRMSIDDLIGIRKRGNGKGYFEKLADFRISPNDGTAGAVKEQLQEYASELCSKIPGPRKQLITFHQLRRPVLAGGGLASLASAAGPPIIGSSPATTAVFSSISAASAFATFYVLIEGEFTRKRKQQETSLNFRIHEDGEIQMDLTSDYLLK